MRNPPVLWDIESDPALAGTKLIAEAWDAAGLYQVGSFIGDSWKEWNGRFRDDVRSFCRGDEGSLTRFADRLVGSPAIYGHKEREAEQSVNFVTCHDGFTLNNLVSYDHKHNEANGEDNRDGANDNRSWSCGVEGPTDDPGVEKLRNPADWTDKTDGAKESSQCATNFAYDSADIGLSEAALVHPLHPRHPWFDDFSNFRNVGLRKLEKETGDHHIGR
jgi:hypothetical protein